MRKLLMVLAFQLAIAGYSQANMLGVGIILGEPSGLSGKFWLDKTSAIDACLAWSFINLGSFHIHSDYLWHEYSLFPVNSGRLGVYFGGGLGINFEAQTKMGIRIPVGINYVFEKYPIDVFLELVPILDLIPATMFDFNIGIGVRYYFDLESKNNSTKGG